MEKTLRPGHLVRAEHPRIYGELVGTWTGRDGVEHATVRVLGSPCLPLREVAVPLARLTSAPAHGEWQERARDLRDGCGLDVAAVAAALGISAAAAGALLA